MNIKRATIYTLTTLLITACNHLPQLTETVDRRDLVRSMIYTQRNLLSLELDAHAAESETRYPVLLQSHCDLINREVVYAKETPSQCQSPADRHTQHCIANFHRCIGLCPSFKQECRRCEQQATLCLKPKG